MKLVNEIVKEMLEKHTGGEKFFDNLDKSLQNTDIVEHFVASIVSGYEAGGFDKVIVSGKFGIFLNNYLRYSDQAGLPFDCIMVRGGLRHDYMDGELEYLRDAINNKRFVFVDDSFYSGHTRDAIKREVERCAGQIVSSYVVYDGSKDKDDTVYSLYRYYK